MFMTNQFKSFSQSKPWTVRVLLVFLTIIVLLSLVRASLPFAIKFGAISWLESQGVEAEVGDIEISLLDGKFAINDVSGKSKNEKGFSLGRFAVAWQWKPLFDHLAIIDQLEVRSLSVDAAFFDNGDMNVAGLVLKATAGETKPGTTEQSTATPWDATVKNIAFSDVGFCLQKFSDADKLVLDYCGKLAGFDWAGDISFKASAQADTPDAPPLYIKGTLNINDIVLQNNQLNLNLVSIGSVDVKSVSIDTPNNISVESIEVAKFSALQRASQTSSNDAQVFAFASLEIQPLRLSQLNDLSLGTIKITDSSAFFLINKDGHMDFAQWLPEKQEQASDEQIEAPVTAAKPFHYAFDEFIFITGQHFVFVDDSLKETFTADIHDMDIRITKLDNNAPDNLSHVSLALAIGTHGSFKLDADTNPLSKRPSLKGVGEIAGLDLRMVAPMTKQHIGHNVRSGQLDADLKLDVDKGIIDSNMGLALHQFELKTLSTEEAEELNSEFGFPLNSSLSLLRDSDNTIRLDIPITGDVDAPEFDPRDAFVKASSSAITAAVLSYYTPFGLVFAAESLFDLATALNFEPIVFDAGEAELNARHREGLDKLATLMSERPGIHLTLCGISNDVDKDKLFPVPAKADAPAQEQQSEAPKEQPDTVKPLSKENIITLKQLAESRSANIKNYLVNKKSINASKLIECSPEYVGDEIAGVKISL